MARRVAAGSSIPREPPNEMTGAGNAIGVLVVDDSEAARHLIRAALESDPGIVVVGEAANGVEAIAKIASLKPDVVTMDIEMPVMGGLEAIAKIIANDPLPILAVTAHSGVRTAFAAVSVGAMDVIDKKDIGPGKAQALIRKVLTLSKMDVAAHHKAMGGRDKTGEGKGVVHRRSTHPRIVAIAASTGGPQALHVVLSHLPAAFPLPIVITQHIAEGFTQGMAQWLDGASPLTVQVAQSGARLLPGVVYINPAEHSMKVTEQGAIVLGDREPNLIYRPSCNTLLASVAAAYKKDGVGLIMSGMGDDGVAGMKAISRAGGITLAQDAKSSVVYGMNRLAVEDGSIQKVVPLAEIASELALVAGGGS